MPRELKPKTLSKMSNEALIKKGYIRIPSFTRKDGTKVKSHIRKLTPSQMEGHLQIISDNKHNSALKDVNGVKAPVMNVNEIVTFDADNYGRQTPEQIVTAEKRAGNFGKKRGNVTMVKVEKTGKNEVTYTNTLHNATGRGGFKKMVKQIEKSVKVALMNSSVDRANIEKGITYKFKYTHAATNVFADVVYSDAVTIAFSAKKPKKTAKPTKSAAQMRKERLARARKRKR